MRGFAVAGWVDVAAAGEDEAIETGDPGGRSRFVELRGEEDGQSSGVLDRTLIGSVELDAFATDFAGGDE